MRVSLVMALLLGVGCGVQTPPAADQPAEAGVADTAVACPAQALDLTAVPSKVSASEGGRVHLPMPIANPRVQIRAEGLAGSSEIQTAKTREFVVRLPYGARDTQRIVLAASCDGHVVQRKTIEVEVRALRFSAATDWASDGIAGPTAREHPAVWIDPANPDRLQLFGGMAFKPKQYTVVWDHWELDLGRKTWSARQVSDAPHAAGGRAVAIGDSVYYHGGTDTRGYALPGLFRLSEGQAASWTQLPAAGDTPAAPVLSSLVYDAARDRLINICGARPTGEAHCDVTAYDLKTGRWGVLATTGSRPSGRIGFAYAHDTEGQRVVVAFGEQNMAPPANPAHDTWALELSTTPPRWTRVDDGSQVLGRRNACWAFDPQGRRLFVWGGTATGATAFKGLYALSLDAAPSRWQQVDTVGERPAARSSGVGVYDAARRRILMGFGNNEVAIYADLWALEL